MSAEDSLVRIADDYEKRIVELEAEVERLKLENEKLHGRCKRLNGELAERESDCDEYQCELATVRAEVKRLKMACVTAAVNARKILSGETAYQRDLLSHIATRCESVAESEGE